MFHYIAKMFGITIIDCRVMCSYRHNDEAFLFVVGHESSYFDVSRFVMGVANDHEPVKPSDSMQPLLCAH